MSFKELSESGILYALAMAALLLVVLGIAYYLRNCYIHALECGVKKEIMKKVIKSSMIFAVVPSLAVVVGLVALVTVIGTPYAWLRLSVLGSVSYELMASDIALKSIGADIATADGNAFGLMMWVMCTGITLPLILNVFMCKKLHLGSLKLGEKDAKWGQISQATFMGALLITLAVPAFGKGMAQCLTFATSMVAGFIIMALAKNKKLSWLGDFTLALSLLAAMTASVGFDKLFA